MNSDIIFVTYYRDIGRGNWSVSQRSNHEYMSYFLTLANNIKYKLVAFVDENMLNMLKTHIFDDNVLFYDANLIDGFYNKYLDLDKHVIQSKNYIDRIPHNRRFLPEHTSSEYNLIMHTKINCIRKAKELYPSYSFYSWVDFGFCRDINFVPENLNVSLFPKKIIAVCFKIPGERMSETEVLLNHSHDIYIQGSHYIIHSSLVEEFEKDYENKLIKWYSDYVSDDDQHTLLQLYYDKPEMFHLIKHSKWFELFQLLPKNN